MSGVPPYKFILIKTLGHGIKFKENTLRSRPLFIANMVRNSSVELNSGRLYIFCKVGWPLRATISSTG
jgi:hypothetical protein